MSTIILIRSHYSNSFLTKCVDTACKDLEQVGGFEQVHRIGNELHVKTSLDATAELLLKTGGKNNFISHI